MTSRYIAMISKPIRQLVGGTDAGRITSLLKRLMRWYLSPSGLLLALALGLLLLTALDVGPSRAFGVGAVGLLAIFFPYRFSRQQGRAHDATTALANQLALTQRQLTQMQSGEGELVSVAEDRMHRASEQLGLRLRLTEDEVSDVRDGLAAREDVIKDVRDRLAAVEAEARNSEPRDLAH